MKQASLLFVYKAEQGNNIVTVARYGGTILSGWCKGKACHFEQKKKKNVRDITWLHLGMWTINVRDNWFQKLYFPWQVLQPSGQCQVLP